MPCCRGARLPPSDGLWAPLAGPRHLRRDPDPAASCRAEAAHPCDRPHPAHTQTSAPPAGAESRMHGRVWAGGVMLHQPFRQSRGDLSTVGGGKLALLRQASFKPAFSGKTRSAGGGLSALHREGPPSAGHAR